MDLPRFQNFTLEQLYEQLAGWRAGGTGYQEIADEIGRRQMRELLRLVDEQTKSAKILEKYTGTLIRLTWALVWLAVALLIFTVGTTIFH